MTGVRLRAYVMLDRLQAGLASFLGTVVRGFLPRPGDCSLFVEVSPGIAVNVVTDAALKATAVEPGIQHIERYYGLLEVHSKSQAEVKAAGRAILGALDQEESSRIKPRVLSSQLIEDVDDHQVQPINRMRRGDLLVAGETLLILETQPAAYAVLAANEAEKGAKTKVLDVEGTGSMGRIYLGGTKRHMVEALEAATTALERVSGVEDASGP